MKWFSHRQRQFLIVLASTWMFVGHAAVSNCSQPERQRPNVVLVMTDDQGYGDVGCHGNQQIKTPHLDRLHAQCTRLTNFHVDPTCSPTRSALMTGRYSSRTGVWHTIMGRSLLRRDEVTIADLFAAAGYQTGVFGKWHLGDNYPYRPQDRGFHVTVNNGGGGVTQTPDYWGNDYFDDTYWRNGKPEKFEGYCTDVFFREAMRFIETNRNRPFFCYIPTNAPHGPFYVDEKYSRPYRDAGIDERRANFYGMITNIDENMGMLVRHLHELGLDENTILIFMTDNGTAAGYRTRRGTEQGFNAGMRGTKGSEYDGGHRVPFFIRWPGKFEPGRDIDRIAAHVDVLPTLAELCRVPLTRDVKLDGKSLVPLLTGEGEWSDRTLLVHSQRLEHPEKWRKCSVMTDRWRLVNGKELFDMRADSGQRNDVSSRHGDVVARLRREYEAWWTSISGRFDEYCEIVIGNEKENPTRLTCHDWHTENVPWNQPAVQKAPLANGYWAINVEREGTYKFTLRQQPAAAGFPIEAETARIEIGGVDESKPIPKGADHITLTAKLNPGKTRLQTWFTNTGGQSRGAFFVNVHYLPAGDAFPDELVHFAPYEKNPVFTAADRAGAWDSRIRERGWILRDGEGYHLWYTGYDGSRGGLKMLGYATSADGLQWRRHPGNPIHRDHWVEDMMVLKHDGTYFMAAEGVKDVAHLLASTDKVHWKRVGAFDVRTTDGEPIAKGPYGTPTLWLENGIWHLFYERRDHGVWLATSKDRKVWTNVSDDPVLARGPERYDRFAVAMNQIVKQDGRYYGYYHASDTPNWQEWSTNVAVSTDLVYWHKYPGNPILTENKSSGILVHDGKQYRLYTMHDRVQCHFPAKQ